MPGLGLRQGECFGLAVEDVDFLRRVVHVRRQVKIVRSRHVFALPKGEKPRDIPLPDSVALALAAHLEVHPGRPVTLPWREPDGAPATANLVMTSTTGLSCDRNTFNRYSWKPALEAAAVPDGRDTGTHQLRHHFASVVLYHGVDVRALSEYLGHTDPGFTLRVCTHLMLSAHDRMRDAVDEASRNTAHGPRPRRPGTSRKSRSDAFL
jgi:integrase